MKSSYKTQPNGVCLSCIGRCIAEIIDHFPLPTQTSRSHRRSICGSAYTVCVPSQSRMTHTWFTVTSVRCGFTIDVWKLQPHHQTHGFALTVLTSVATSCMFVLLQLYIITIIDCTTAAIYNTVLTSWFKILGQSFYPGSRHWLVGVIDWGSEWLGSHWLLGVIDWGVTGS